jgi:hypothetical protein
MGLILAGDPDLALEWLQVRLGDSDLPTYLATDSPFLAAARSLRREQKEQLLRELEPLDLLHSLIPAVVGRDVDLFRRLLSRLDLRDFHLEPLGAPQSPDWEGFALVALDAGYEPRVIASHALHGPHSWAGSGVEYWEKWDQAFAAFEGHSRTDFREVVRRSRDLVQAELSRARDHQKHFELHGLGREA